MRNHKWTHKEAICVALDLVAGKRPKHIAEDRGVPRTSVQAIRDGRMFKGAMEEARRMRDLIG